ncbi:MAG: glycosyltransferase family 9 protein [Alphaproteobacteria bacterium]|nr:glycosyltransferase family 9 protein [Alphaproteobacteria bacterium]
MTPNNILVIRLSALGDIVSSLGPMAAIRRHHHAAKITLLTMPEFVPLLQPSGYFDEIWCDERAPWWGVTKILNLRRRLARAGFDRVYDLQTSKRTARYFQIWPYPKPEWSGHAKGASHCDRVNPDREISHTIDRQKFQLKLAGISEIPDADLGFLPPSDLSKFNLPRDYALMVPGCSASQTWKRWPIESYIAVAQKLVQAKVTPVIIGSVAETELCQLLAKSVPEALNLNGATDLISLVSLARSCRLAIGNDTGPMHMITASGRPVLVLTTSDILRHKTAPRGRFVRHAMAASLAEISVETVWQDILLILSQPA